MEITITRGKTEKPKYVPKTLNIEIKIEEEAEEKSIFDTCKHLNGLKKHPGKGRAIIQAVCDSINEYRHAEDGETLVEDCY